MKERPILFSAPMVKAILEGRKTQTRRVVKHVPALGYPFEWCLSAELGVIDRAVGDYTRYCPYGQFRDRLWVRESGNIATDKSAWMYPDAGGKLAPTAPVGSESWAREWKSCPSIHMPRWASRLTLEITSVRIGRAQSISDDAALAEGVKCEGLLVDHEPRIKFRELWDSINGQRAGCAWADNPWVWVVEFRRVRP